MYSVSTMMLAEGGHECMPTYRFMVKIKPSVVRYRTMSGFILAGQGLIRRRPASMTCP